MKAKVKHLDGFVTIRTSSLLPMHRLPVDVFVPVTGRAVRYASANDEIEESRLERLKKFRFAKVFIRADDEEKYRAFVSSVLEEAENSAAIPLTQRTQAVVAGTESASENIAAKPTDKLTFQSSVAEFERFSRFLAKNEEALANILRESGKAADYVSHGIQVAALSLLIAEKTSLPGLSSKRNSLVTGGFLHDIASESLGLPFVSTGQRSAQELTAWKEHPLTGWKLFSDKDWVNGEILNIIAQHEELPSGQGFPHSMIKARMDPLAVVASLANRFDDCARELGGDFEAVRKEFVKRNLSHFDLSMIEVLIAGMKSILKP